MLVDQDGAYAGGTKINAKIMLIAAVSRMRGWHAAARLDGLGQGDFFRSLPAGLMMFGNDRGIDAAPDVEPGGQAHETW